MRIYRSARLEDCVIYSFAATERLLAECLLVKVIILTVYNMDGYLAKSVKMLLLRQASE